MPITTTFTYGDPTPVPAFIAVGGVHRTLVGVSFTGIPPVVPLDVVLPNGTVGSAYSTTITVTGGTGPYTFAITAGTLPSGLSLNTSTGVISGTATTAGSSSFTIQATDSLGATGSTAFSLVVGAAPAVNYGWVG